ncbi:unnamed protein product [Caenorhabditis angaria]|uniref:Uncharacterized protein n=1 Tax=Caenorhabditis angaria TaxID=860376 RepID=A0A9P1I4V0_9PELO|nr:unnamed protein product [Caenorhabditis angaria]
MTSNKETRTTEVEVRRWFDDVINDKKYFSARILENFANTIGQNVEITAKVGVMVFLILLIFVKEAHLLANFAIILIPFLQTYVYPSEKPTPNIHFIHHIIFGCSVLFDRILELIPCYYVLKVALFVALYHPPSNRCIDNIESLLVKIAGKN